MLLEVKQYLLNRNICSLIELSKHFKTSPDAMRGILSHWVRKGHVIAETVGCNQGCSSCMPEQLEMYRWQSTSRQIPICNLH